MKMNLVRIRENGFLFDKVAAGEGTYEASWHFSFNFGVKRGGNILEVRFIAKAETAEGSGVVLMTHDASHYFYLEEMERFTTRPDNKEFDEIAQAYLRTMMSIAISGARGMVYARSGGIFGDEFFLPLAYPANMVDGMVPFKFEEEEE